MSNTRSTAVERQHGNGALAEHGADQRALDRLMARARIYAKVPGLKKELAGQPDAVAGVMLSLEGDGLPATIPNINDCFDWIEGRAARTAHSYQVLAYRDGYELIPLVDDSPDYAEILVQPRNGERPKKIRFTLQQAIDAEKLDEWVEQWEKKNVKQDGVWKDRNFKTKYVVRRNGQPINEPWPDWVVAQVDAGQVKRFDAWWLYRADMLYKSCAKRAVKKSCPHVLSGVRSSSDFDHDPNPIPVDDDTIADCEVIGDDTPEEMVSNAAAKRELLARYRAQFGLDEEQAKAPALLLWRSHQLPDGEPIPRRRLDALLSVFAAKPARPPDSPEATAPESPVAPPSGGRGDPPPLVVVDEDTGEIVDQGDDQPEMVVTSETPGPEQQRSFLDDEDPERPF